MVEIHIGRSVPNRKRNYDQCRSTTTVSKPMSRVKLIKGVNFRNRMPIAGRLRSTQFYTKSSHAHR
jgi:hypothetical protein